MPSLGLKGSKNVSMNKKKLCDLLDRCVAKGSKHTVHLITYLVNKLEDSIIRNLTAQERKKSLDCYYNDQCHGHSNRIRLIFDNPYTHSKKCLIKWVNLNHLISCSRRSAMRIFPQALKIVTL